MSKPMTPAVNGILSEQQRVPYVHFKALWSACIFKQMSVLLRN